MTDSETRPRRRRFKWRPWLRAIHRDLGYLVVGFTLIYALSGIAVNHLEDWDPNFQHVDKTHEVDFSNAPAEPEALATWAAEQVGISEVPTDVFELEPGHVEVTFEETTLEINRADGKVFEVGQQSRFLLRIANWLHLNRGKKVWTWFADGYAVILLYLAVSGLFMIPGRKGLIGRGGIIMAVGVLVPILYVHFSGGP
ncbi:MAG: hypothetical protein ACI9OJ_001880 [Myxococcota bacterium]|jgi:hypothetical protein